MATILTPSGAEFQINVNSGGNNGISGAQDLANLAVLTDGRFVVTYQSDYFGSATDTDPIVAIFNSSGTTSLAYRDAYNAGGLQKVPAVAERLNGGRDGLQNDRHANNTVDANGPNITYVPVSVPGGVFRRSPSPISTPERGMTPCKIRQSPRFRADGRLSRSSASGRRADHDVFLNVVNAAGTATQFSIANPLDVQANASWQANPTVAAIGNSALVVFEEGPARPPQAQTSGDGSLTAARTRSARPSPSRITRRDYARPMWRRSTTIDTRSSMAIRTTLGEDR